MMAFERPACLRRTYPRVTHRQMIGGCAPPSRLEIAARWMLFGACVLALLAAYGCANAPAQIDTGMKVGSAFAALAAAWIANLQAAGVITPEQGAEFAAVVGQAQTTMDTFGVLMKALAGTVTKLQADITAAKSGSVSTEALVGTGLATAAATVATVQKLRGPSATPEERVKRRGG